MVKITITKQLFPFILKLEFQKISKNFNSIEFKRFELGQNYNYRKTIILFHFKIGISKNELNFNSI